MPVKEREFFHVRLHRANAEKLMRITAKTRRSINMEANIIIEQFPLDTGETLKGKHENKTRSDNARVGD
jgi:hypothetical protein